MKEPLHNKRAGSAQSFHTYVITEKTARQRFKELLQEEHDLGDRRSKGRCLYQVVCDAKDRWVALFLWVGACWHLRPRDEWVGWDGVKRSERLQFIVHQARFLVLSEARDSVWSSAMLAASIRDLPGQWAEVYEYRPLLAETFTDPETHAGTCYRAAGWQAVGLSSGTGKHYADVYPGMARPKKLWLKELEPNGRGKLCAPKLPESQRAGLATHAAVRCALKMPQLNSLYEVFSQMPDPRRRNARRYLIGAVLTVIALGLLGGAVHLSTIVRTAQKLTQQQRRQLRLPRKKGTRFYSIPGYDVFRTVLHGIDLEALARHLTRWLQSHTGELPRTLAVDGKTIRDHLGLIVALVDTEEGVPVALAANVKGKGHELKTTQALLSSPQVNLLNATVTADSLHCQDETAHLIVREKGGDYLLQVRDNQPTLRALAEQQLASQLPLFLPSTATAAEPSCVNSAG
jgi:hypothetical protein